MHSRLVTTTSHPSGSSMRGCRCGQAGERFLHHVLGVAQVQQDAAGDNEHPASGGRSRAPREPDRRRQTGRRLVLAWRFLEGRLAGGGVGASRLLADAFLPDQLQHRRLGTSVATAIVERAWVSLSAWRNRQSARSSRAVNRWPMWSISTP
jgi:hypothetical protein